MWTSTLRTHRVDNVCAYLLHNVPEQQSSSCEDRPQNEILAPSVKIPSRAPSCHCQCQYQANSLFDELTRPCAAESGVFPVRSSAIGLAPLANNPCTHSSRPLFANTKNAARRGDINMVSARRWVFRLSRHPFTSPRRRNCRPQNGCLRRVAQVLSSCFESPTRDTGVACK